MANLGVRPTVDGTHRAFEVHLFGFNGNLYGEDLEVEFVRFIRGERKFGSLDELKRQIAVDCQAAAECLEKPA